MLLSRLAPAYLCTCVSKAYKVIRDALRHQTHSEGVPDHLINTTACVFEGQKIDTDAIPSHARQTYMVQGRIGWTNYARGRIARSWGALRTTNSKGVVEISSKWQTSLIATIIEWLHRKWVLRCELCSSPEAD